jgi:transcriptional regulator NrdR family protein
MKSVFEENVITESLNRIIEKGWVTANPHIRIEAIAQEIVDNLEDARKEEAKQVEIGNMFLTMQKYFPQKFDHLFNKEEHGKSENS